MLLSACPKLFSSLVQLPTDKFQAALPLQADQVKFLAGLVECVALVCCGYRQGERLSVMIHANGDGLSRTIRLLILRDTPPGIIFRIRRRIIEAKLLRLSANKIGDILVLQLGKQLRGVGSIFWMRTHSESVLEGFWKVEQ